MTIGTYLPNSAIDWDRVQLEREKHYRREFERQQIQQRAQSDINHAISFQKYYGRVPVAVDAQQAINTAVRTSPPRYPKKSWIRRFFAGEL